MATSLKNLSDYDPKRVPSAENMSFGIVVSEWNNNVTDDLLKGALEALIKHGAKNSNIEILHVPGSFELIAGAKMMLRQHNPDAIICLGSVIRGDTPHFDYVCHFFSLYFGLFFGDLALFLFFSLNIFNPLLSVCTRVK